jgi:choline-sulfatase
MDVIIGNRIRSALKNRPGDKPFFLFGSFVNPHNPYDPPKRYLEMEELRDTAPIEDRGRPLSAETRERINRLARSYRGAVRLLDDQIGMILKTLEEENLLEKTIIFFTSDHGEMLGDHGSMLKQSFYRSSLTVPAAVRHPGYLAKRRIESPVEITDITASILEAAGLDPERELSRAWPAGNDNVPCRSLFPLISGDKRTIRDYTFSECNNAWQAFQSDEWKYVRIMYQGLKQFGRKNYPEKRFQERLYNLRNDPRELADESLNPRYRKVIEYFRRERDFVLETTPFAQTGWAPYRLT